jgi:hypothetical protein
MDLRNFYQTIARIEAEIAEEFTVVVSSDGVKTEVPRALAARLAVEGAAEIASEDEAREFREQVERRWRAAQRGRS